MPRHRSATRAVLTTSAAVATTANAWRPFAKEGPVALASFGSGLVTSEFPLLAAGSQLASLAGLAARGRVRGRTGALLTAATAGSVATLVALDREARRSGEVLERALIEGLGRDYRDRLGTYEASPHGTRLTRADIRVSLRGDRRRWAASRDVAYGDAGRRNLLDIWRRPDLPADAGAPVLIQVHGGGWVTGSKETQGVPLLKHMAQSGWVCVAVNYRLSPRAAWPDHIVDVKRAIAWVKEHIAEHGGDPGFVAITGGSAGGHLSSLAALTPNDPLFQPGFESADTTLDAAVPFYGVYDWTNRDGTGNLGMERLLAERVLKVPLASDRARWEHASPMSHVGPHAPPMFCLHGTNDTLVPVEQARSFVRLLKAASEKPVVYGELPKAQHAFEVFGSIRAAHTVRAAARFLSFVHAGVPREATATAASEPSPVA
jgi:acetyl esterase/lipase